METIGRADSRSLGFRAFGIRVRVSVEGFGLGFGICPVSWLT